LADYFDAAVKGRPVAAAKTAANLAATELLARLNAEGLSAEASRIAAGELGALAALVEDGTLSSKGAKAAFAAMWSEGCPAGEAVLKLGLAQVSDEARLAVWVGEALAANPKAVADLKAGNERAVGSIVGAVMKLSKGKANPGIVNRLIQESIKAPKAG
jgi:aspartyl-tRNA(Asn)/glutamyl-tRNA(Gln) amidotransferase subunit B